MIIYCAKCHHKHESQTGNPAILYCPNCKTFTKHVPEASEIDDFFGKLFGMK